MSLGEPSESQVENEDFCDGAQPGAQSKTDSPPIDPELSALIAAWPTLPEAIRLGILAMVEAAGTR